MSCCLTVHDENTNCKMERVAYTCDKIMEAVLYPESCHMLLAYKTLNHALALKDEAGVILYSSQ